MKQKSKKLIKSLLISAAMTLIPTHSEAKEISPIDLDNDDADQLNALKAPVWHNVMKVGPNGSVTGVNDHRSHMSHRSHSSHRSSRYGHSSHYSSSHYSSSSSYVSKPVKNYMNYSLGDRTLSQGLYGNDVDALVTKLKNFHYLRESYSTQKNNYSLYSADVAQGVKYFQKDAGLPVTGVMDSKTKKAFDDWSAYKSTRRLGIRKLEEGDEGEDVAELIRLLTKAGFAPNPEKVGENERKYSQDVATAVKVFQAFCGLTVTGIADYDTIDKLKSKAK